MTQSQHSGNFTKDFAFSQQLFFSFIVFGSDLVHCNFLSFLSLVSLICLWNSFLLLGGSILL